MAQAIGAGWSAFAAVNGFAVTMEQRGPAEMVTCYDAASGALAWSHEVQTRHESVLGGVGRRSAPTIDQGRVYALGAAGVLRCLDRATGQALWIHDLLAMHGMTPESDMQAVAWGRAASPLVVGQGGRAGGRASRRSQGHVGGIRYDDWSKGLRRGAKSRLRTHHRSWRRSRACRRS